MVKAASILFLILLVTACHEPVIPSLGDTNIMVFDTTQVYFDMELKSNPTVLADSIYRLDAGRVILKKVKLPKYHLQPALELKVTLSSNGDPWDKSGSVFVIPATSDITLQDFEDGTFDLKQLNETYPAISPFEQDSSVYYPNVELLRFMTPFGVGFFNDNERARATKPVYIPKWEKEVNWTQDLTHLLPLLEEEVYIGVYIDTWTKEGYRISVSLDYTESEIPNHKKKAIAVLPLVNTVKYAWQQRNFDGFSQQAVSVDFTAETAFKNAKLYYLTTGHGGHATGDEFTQKENLISLDGTLLHQFIPWRDDCASFRRFNPSSGVWAEKADSSANPRMENIASSDLSRSNWCPGSDVTPTIIELGDLKMGKHQLSIAIPEAQVTKKEEHNYWMVSAYLVYEK